MGISAGKYFPAFYKFPSDDSTKVDKLIDEENAILYKKIRSYLMVLDDEYYDPHSQKYIIAMK